MVSRRLLRLVLGLGILVLTGWWPRVPSALAQQTVLRTYPVGPLYEDRWKLLELALAHAAGHPGQFRLLPYSESPSQRRAFALLDEGALDVVSYGSAPEREAGYLPVRIDLLRGMLGYRELLARSADVERIGQLDDAELRGQLRVGGASDTQQANLAVLQANGFQILAAPHRERMYDMLEGGRFDVHSVGVNELFQELANLRAHRGGIARVPRIALYYPFPAYFWVRRDRQELARLIESGLRASLADGSFRRVFEASHAAEIALLRNEPQRVIRLANPLLPATDREAVDTSWWWPRTADAHRGGPAEPE